MHLGRFAASKTQRSLQLNERLLVATQPVVCRAEQKARLVCLRRNSDGLLEESNGLGLLALFQRQVRQTHQSGSIVRSETKSLLKLQFGALAVSRCCVCCSEIHARLGIPRLQCYQSFQQGNGFVVQLVPQVKGSRGPQSGTVLRLQIQHSEICGEGFSLIAPIRVGFAQGKVCWKQLRVTLDRNLERNQRGIQLL